METNTPGRACVLVTHGRESRGQDVSCRETEVRGTWVVDVYGVGQSTVHGGVRVDGGRRGAGQARGYWRALAMKRHSKTLDRPCGMAVGAMVAGW